MRSNHKPGKYAIMLFRHPVCRPFLVLLFCVLALPGLIRPALADPADIAAASRGVVRVVRLHHGVLLQPKTEQPR